MDIVGTYDTNTFKSMRYVLIDFQWCKKHYFKALYAKSKPWKSLVDSAAVLLKKVEGLQERLIIVKYDMLSPQKSMGKIYQVNKHKGVDVGKLRITVDSFKGEGVL